MRARGEEKKKKKKGARGDSMAGATNWFWTKTEIRNQVLLIK